MTTETSRRPADGRRAITIDYDKYLGLLEDMDATDDEKQLYIETLAEILLRFVDLGFDVHPYSEDSRQNPPDSVESKVKKEAAHVPEPM